MAIQLLEWGAQDEILISRLYPQYFLYSPDFVFWKSDFLKGFFEVCP